MLEQNFAAAKVRAMLDDPLLASLITEVNMQLCPTLDGIADSSDGSLVIMIKPDLMQQFLDGTQINIMHHEIKHAVERYLTIRYESSK